MNSSELDNIGIYINEVKLSTLRYAGEFYGEVHVTGKLFKDMGGFQIDHPLDPTNKYLYHSFVKTSNMKNIYDGVAVLDTSGKAEVELPAWFGEVNKDFRYQLLLLVTNRVWTDRNANRVAAALSKI